MYAKVSRFCVSDYTVTAWICSIEMALWFRHFTFALGLPPRYWSAGVIFVLACFLDRRRHFCCAICETMMCHFLRNFDIASTICHSCSHISHISDPSCHLGVPDCAVDSIRFILTLPLDLSAGHHLISAYRISRSDSVSV